MEVDQEYETESKKSDNEILILSLSKQAKNSKSNDLAHLKLKYEEILEEKNQRMLKLESKNR